MEALLSFLVGPAELRAERQEPTPARVGFPPSRLCQPTLRPLSDECKSPCFILRGTLSLSLALPCRLESLTLTACSPRLLQWRHPVLLGPDSSLHRCTRQADHIPILHSGGQGDFKWSDVAAVSLPSSSAAPSPACLSVIADSGLGEVTGQGP